MMIVVSLTAYAIWGFTWLFLLVILLWLLWLRQQYKLKQNSSRPFAIDFKSDPFLCILHYQQKIVEFDKIKVFENRWFIILQLSSTKPIKFLQAIQSTNLYLQADNFESKSDYASIRRLLLNL